MHWSQAKNALTVEVVSDSLVECGGRCRITGKPHTVRVDRAGFYEWRAGALIQKALPLASVDDREFLISGTSPEGWQLLFGQEEGC